MQGPGINRWQLDGTCNAIALYGSTHAEDYWLWSSLPMSRTHCLQWIISGADPVGGPEGPWPPPAEAKCPRFWAKCLQIWAKYPHLHQSAPRIWAKCPPFVTKVPWFHSGTTPNAPFRGHIFKIFWGRTPRPPLYSVTLRIFHSNANWVAQHARVMCPLILLAPPAPTFWISPWLYDTWAAWLSLCKNRSLNTSVIELKGTVVPKEFRAVLVPYIPAMQQYEHQGYMIGFIPWKLTIAPTVLSKLQHIPCENASHPYAYQNRVMSKRY